MSHSVVVSPVELKLSLLALTMVVSSMSSTSFTLKGLEQCARPKQKCQCTQAMDSQVKLLLFLTTATGLGDTLFGWLVASTQTMVLEPLKSRTPSSRMLKMNSRFSHIIAVKPLID